MLPENYPQPIEVPCTEDTLKEIKVTKTELSQKKVKNFPKYSEARWQQSKVKNTYNIIDQQCQTILYEGPEGSIICTLEKAKGGIGIATGARNHSTGH